MKTIFILFCSIISCFGQAFTWHDLAMVESQNGTNASIPFSPTDVVGLVLWLDANSITSPTNVNGYLVTNWWDKSTNAYMAYNAGNAQQPYYTNNVARIGGKPWLQFDGVGTYLSTGQFAEYVQTNTIFCVAYGSNGAVSMTYFAGTNSNHQLLSAATDKLSMTAGSSISGNNSSWIAGGWYLLECTFAGAGSIIFTNGVSYKTGNAGTGGLKGFRIGANQTPGNYLGGGIAEVLVYNTANYLSASDLTAIRTYFTNKYGTYNTW